MRALQVVGFYQTEGLAWGSSCFADCPVWNVDTPESNISCHSAHNFFLLEEFRLCLIYVVQFPNNSAIANNVYTEMMINRNILIYVHSFQMTAAIFPDVFPHMHQKCHYNFLNGLYNRLEVGCGFNSCSMLISHCKWSETMSVCRSQRRFCLWGSAGFISDLWQKSSYPSGSRRNADGSWPFLVM